MKLKRGAWDGAQQRTHVLKVLRESGVSVQPENDDYYLLVDPEGDPLVMHVPNPVPSEIIEALYRHFGHLGFKITDLRSPHGGH
ncbi:hypothetical protein [Lysobacter sp. 22409]|uniref:hypothetical protein n=1 Tax=Lysobacter sp. 22409 TaxID=3453917 RepID=UPI003F849B2D